MDAFTLVLWALRIGFVVCLYLFLRDGGPDALA